MIDQDELESGLDSACRHIPRLLGLFSGFLFLLGALLLRVHIRIRIQGRGYPTMDADAVLGKVTV